MTIHERLLTTATVRSKFAISTVPFAALVRMPEVWNSEYVPEGNPLPSGARSTTVYQFLKVNSSGAGLCRKAIGVPR